MCSGTITVEQNGSLSGTGLLQKVVVKKGGSVKGGAATSSLGALRINGNLTMQSGSTTLVRLYASSANNTRLTVNGTITHNDDTLLVEVPASRRLSVGEEIIIYTNSYTGATGNVIVKCVTEDGSDYIFDTSRLNTDGVLVVSDVLTDINLMLEKDSSFQVDVFTVDGRKLRDSMPYHQALNGLSAGTYVVGVRTTDGRFVSRKEVKR